MDHSWPYFSYVVVIRIVKLMDENFHLFSKFHGNLIMDRDSNIDQRDVVK